MPSCTNAQFVASGVVPALVTVKTSSLSSILAVNAPSLFITSCHEEVSVQNEPFCKRFLWNSLHPVSGIANFV